MLSFSNPKNYRIYKVIFFTNLLKLDSNPHKQVDLDPQQKKMRSNSPTIYQHLLSFVKVPDQQLRGPLGSVSTLKNVDPNLHYS